MFEAFGNLSDGDEHETDWPGPAISNADVCRECADDPPCFYYWKETTLVEGPLNADGTIDYIPAINALIGGKVKNEDNAAIPLILLTAGGNKSHKIDDRNREILEALHVQAPANAEINAQYFQNYIAEKNGTADTLPSVEEAVRQSELAERLRLGPWRTADQPQAAEWLKASEAALNILDDASKRSGFFLPFCVHAKTSVGGALDASPDIMLLFVPRDLLLSRAMMHAGEGDLSAALADIHRLRKLARLTEQEHVFLMHVFAMGPDADAMKACAGMAASGTCMREELAMIRAEIMSLPALSDDDDIREQVEEMQALDMIMQCIRGNSERLMRLMTLDFGGNSPINLGDWANADWDVALRETVRLHSVDIAPGNNFSERMDNLDKKADEGPSLLETINTIADGGDFAANNKTRVETFLKRSPGESREDFTRRVTRWLAGANTSEVSRNMSIGERARMYRVLALCAISLAEYRLTHGEYPESLDKLGAPVPTDGFSGKPVCYKRNERGYTLWSVGSNRKDNEAMKDDLVIGAGK